jgi:hypothetical protein
VNARLGQLVGLTLGDAARPKNGNSQRVFRQNFVTSATSGHLSLGPHRAEPSSPPILSGSRRDEIDTASWTMHLNGALGCACWIEDIRGRHRGV